MNRNENTLKSLTLSTAGLCALAMAALLLALPAVAAKVPGDRGNAAVEASLLHPSGDDLVAERLETAVGPSLPGLSQEAVAFSWPLSAERTLDFNPTPFQSESREYWLQVKAAELRSGVDLEVVSLGALVRINPAGPASRGLAIPLDPASLQVVAPDGEVLDGGEAMVNPVTAEQLAQADSPFAEGTSAFRLRQGLGVGTFTLRAPELSRRAGDYVIHVFEPESDVVLHLQTLRADYLHGDALEVELSLEQNASPVELGRLQASVVSPRGRKTPLAFSPRGDGRYLASWVVDAREAFAEGLWEVQVTVQGQVGELQTRRNARTAFAAALPTARFMGSVRVTAPSAGSPSLDATLGVELASSGRYEVRGVLFGTDALGRLQPMGVAHAADWLEGEQGELTLSFGPEIFADSDLTATYEVQDLRLMDQGRMAVIHRQVWGFRVR